MATHEERLTELEARYQRHDTLINGEMGLIKAIKDLQKTVEELKSFQLRALGGFGVLAIVVQVVVQMVLKK